MSWLRRGQEAELELADLRLVLDELEAELRRERYLGGAQHCRGYPGSFRGAAFALLVALCWARRAAKLAPGPR